MGFSYEDIEDMKVAVSEACNNSVLYAYSHEGGMVEVVFEVDGDTLSITVKDEGASFENMNPAVSRAGLHDKELTEAQIGGLGFYLMQALMDDVSVESETGKESMSEAIGLIWEYQQTQDNEIATVLIRKYEPMVKMAAGKIARNRPDLYEDLYQTGQMALIRLLKQYDINLGIPFEPYAMKSMIGHMKNYLRDKSWYIQVPRRIKEKGALVQHAIDELTVKLERSPGVNEIAEYLDLTAEETIEVLAGRECYHYVSLDSPLSQDDSAATLGELISADVNDYDSVEKRMDLQQALGQLKEQEQQVLILAFQDGQSQRAIAQKLGVSQMSVSRIQKRATEKLKQIMSNASML
ncbi:hypothetical protein HK101_006483 [Irineochytrium annulatum]|nr:hypothetical protein HK101_006483 [Irineochytrium annulatum]